MSSLPAFLIIGATGMLGRPVTRRLVAEGFRVRALVRDRAKASAVLPPDCELVEGDVLDPASLLAAMAGVKTVYINLAAARTPSRPDIEREGVFRIITAARRSGLDRLVKISFMGVPAARRLWWQIEHKAESERAIAESGLRYTIFHPTWFMESIPLFRVGRRLLVPRARHAPIWWISGDDYARQVAAALRDPDADDRSYTVQGPEPLTFVEAARRFAAAEGNGLRVTEVPLAAVRPMAVLAADMRYLLGLLTVTFETNTAFESRDAWDDLGRPGMTIEDYAAYVKRTGDRPSK